MMAFARDLVKFMEPPKRPQCAVCKEASENLYECTVPLCKHHSKLFENFRNNHWKEHPDVLGAFLNLYGRTKET